MRKPGKITCNEMRLCAKTKVKQEAFFLNQARKHGTQLRIVDVFIV